MEEWNARAPVVDWEKVWEYAQIHGPIVLDMAFAIGLVLCVYVLIEKGVKRIHKWRLRRGRDASQLASLKQANGVAETNGSSKTS